MIILIIATVLHLAHMVHISLKDKNQKIFNFHIVNIQDIIVLVLFIIELN